MSARPHSRPQFLHRPPRLHNRSPRWLAAALALALTVTLVPTAGAIAAELPEYLQLDKTIEGLAHRDLAPGEEFTYRIEVRCSEQDCIDAQLVDALPDDLAGFEVVGFSAEPDASAIARTLTWSDTGTATPPTVVTVDSALTVDFDQVFPQSPSTSGLPVGRTFSTSLTLRVPQNLTPSAPINGKLIATTRSSAPRTQHRHPDPRALPSTLPRHSTSPWARRGLLRAPPLTRVPLRLFS